MKSVPPVMSANLLYSVFPLKIVDHLTSVVPLKKVLFSVASVVLLTKVVPVMNVVCHAFEKYKPWGLNAIFILFPYSS